MPTLNWLTREADIGAAGRVPYRLLEEVAEHSAGDADAGNMLIQGDNLEALKALLPFYAGQVKCIYIDPPYNTRSAFAVDALFRSSVSDLRQVRRADTRRGGRSALALSGRSECPRSHHRLGATAPSS